MQSLLDRIRQMLLSRPLVLALCVSGIVGGAYWLVFQDDNLFLITIKGWPILELDVGRLDHYFTPVTRGWFVVVPPTMLAILLRDRRAWGQLFQDAMVRVGMAYVGVTVAILAATSGRVWMILIEGAGVTEAHRYRLRIHHTQLVLETAFIYGLGIALIAVTSLVALVVRNRRSRSRQG